MRTESRGLSAVAGSIGLPWPSRGERLQQQCLQLPNSWTRRPATLALCGVSHVPICQTSVQSPPRVDSRESGGSTSKSPPPKKQAVQEAKGGKEDLLPFLEPGDSPSAFPAEQNQLLHWLLAGLQTIVGEVGQAAAYLRPMYQVRKDRTAATSDLSIDSFILLVSPSGPVTPSHLGSNFNLLFFPKGSSQGSCGSTKSFQKQQ